MGLSVDTAFINGKFTAQSVTGVQRAALEMILALDRALAGGGRRGGARFVLLCPPGATLPRLEHIEVRVVGHVHRGLQWWEQFLLPRAADGGLLLNLSGSAPWLAAHRSICLLHDAAVFDHPDTYTWLFRTWYRLLFRHLAVHAAGLFTVSHFARERLCKALRVPLGRFGVISHGANHFDRIERDDTVLSSYGLQPQRFLLVVGTAKRTKNIESVLKAWRRYRPDPGCVLVWVGGANSLVFSTPESTPFRAAADAQDGIYRVGFVPDSKLKALYENAAGLLLPSIYEGFGFPAVEAMACGCPVAAASMASLPEVCGDAAHFFDPLRIDEIGRVMEILLLDPEHRAILRRRGAEHVQRYTWDASALDLMSRLGEAGIDEAREAANRARPDVPSINQ